MEMHQVRYFVALCETLNFTRAAEKCNVTQPSLTRAIKLLEDELRIKLEDDTYDVVTALAALMKLQQVLPGRVADVADRRSGCLAEATGNRETTIYQIDRKSVV